ncbi:MAG TPA: (Fe-S)-binding protein, partial [Bacteroidales bacterium]|nr:(Fe-S)-binding protein [Bacteroidales bacterium]
MSTLSQEQIERGLDILNNLDNSKLLTHVNSCVHCGLCATSCIYYLAEQDNSLTPAKKVDLLASIYRRYHTFLGKTFPAITGARELNDELIPEMIDKFFGACTMCSRCNIHCSIGLDIAFLVRTGRMMLSEMGMVPATLQSTVNAALTTGNNMGITYDEFVDTIQWLEEDLQDELNDPTASIPLNQPDKNVMYTLNPREPKFFPLSISAMA